MKNATARGLKPLGSCGKFQAFMQMDRDSFFPQIELLEQIHYESPNATFLLMFRNMSDWFRRWVGLSCSTHYVARIPAFSFFCFVTHLIY